MTAANHPLSRRPWRGGSHGARMGACGRGDPFLLHLLPEDMRPPDSFVAETRRHLKGCIDHAATVILRELSLDPQLAQAADAIDPASAWTSVERFPALIDLDLLDHMRARATVRLLTDAMARPGSPPEGAEDLAPGWLDDPEQAVAQDALALLLARSRWSEALLADAPMPLDLPAEAYRSLIWVAAAPIARAIAAMAAQGPERALALVNAAVERLIARHDEERGPQVRARRLAHRLLARPDPAAQAAQALETGDMLMFAALAERDLDAPMDAILAIFWENDVARLAALLRALHCARGAVGRLMDCVPLVSSHSADLLATFDLTDEVTAVERLSDLAIAPVLAAHLSVLEGARG
ncbi:MAG: hypothetical protein U5M50_00085 [Sphingobium sp.]|nr:hypothetical protein [Sphingobium sp.]